MMYKNGKDGIINSERKRKDNILILEEVCVWVCVGVGEHCCDRHRLKLVPWACEKQMVVTQSGYLRRTGWLHCNLKLVFWLEIGKITKKRKKKKGVAVKF